MARRGGGGGVKGAAADCQTRLGCPGFSELCQSRLSTGELNALSMCIASYCEDCRLPPQDFAIGQTRVQRKHVRGYS